MNPSARKLLANLLRVTITLAGLAWVAVAVDLRGAAASLLKIHAGAFWLAVLLFQVGILVRAGRWWWLLKPHSTDLRWLGLVRLYYAGSFFNLALPTGFGGDVVRAAELSARTDPAAAAASVVLDRMLGLMALFAMALVTLPLLASRAPASLLLLTGGVSVVGLLGGGLVMHGGTLRALVNGMGRLPGLSGWGVFQRLADALLGFNDRLTRLTRAPGAVRGAVLLSLVFNALLIVMHGLLSWAVGLDVPPLTYVLIVPITSILLLVPSIQGLGVRESAFVYLLSQFTPQAEHAAALAVAVYLPNLIAGLVGMVVYVGYLLRRR